MAENKKSITESKNRVSDLRFRDDWWNAYSPLIPETYRDELRRLRVSIITLCLELSDLNKFVDVATHISKVMLLTQRGTLKILTGACSEEETESSGENSFEDAMLYLKAAEEDLLRIMEKPIPERDSHEQ